MIDQESFAKGVGVLVLSRKLRQRVMLVHGTTEIAIEVVHIDGDRVRLGFEAPQHVKILREEVYNVMRRLDGGGETCNPPA